MNDTSASYFGVPDDEIILTCSVRNSDVVDINWYKGVYKIFRNLSVSFCKFLSICTFSIFGMTTFLDDKVERKIFYFFCCFYCKKISILPQFLLKRVKLMVLSVE